MKEINARFPAAKGLVGQWYFSSYWNKWDFIIGIVDGWWVVKGDNGIVRSHLTHLRYEGCSPVRIDTDCGSIADRLNLIKQAQREAGWCV